MGLKSLMHYLQKRATDTPDTSAKNMGYRPNAPVNAACTPDTPDTCAFVDTRANELLGQFGEAVNDPASTQPPDAARADKPAKQSFMQWQDSWRDLDKAYQAHHFNCPTCIAAGKGYGLRCGAGAALYTAYSDAT